MLSNNNLRNLSPDEHDKFIQNLSALLVYGYIRKLTLKSNLYIIPSEIQTLCRIFFGKIEIKYELTKLLDLQKHFFKINWSAPDHKEIPQSIRSVNMRVNNQRYMKHVVDMLMRSNSQRYCFHTLEKHTDNNTKLTLSQITYKKLISALSKLTPEKLIKVAERTNDIVDAYATTRDQMHIMVRLILTMGIKVPVFADQYVLLCSYLQKHLNKLHIISDYDWIVNDTDISNTFRQIVIIEANKLFTEHRNLKLTEEEIQICKEEKCDAEITELMNDFKCMRKRNFFRLMVLIAELYNVDLISRNVIFKGVFTELLKNPDAIELEGLCRLFKRCGKKLDKEAKQYVDKYVQQLTFYANKFDFRSRVLVNEIKEIRKNNWSWKIKSDKE